MSTFKALLTTAVVAGFACMFAPAAASAQDRPLCEGSDPEHFECKLYGYPLIIAEAWASPVIKNNYVLIEVYDRENDPLGPMKICPDNTATRCNVDVEWDGDGQSFRNVPPGRYEHDIPSPATSIRMFCYCG